MDGVRRGYAHAGRLGGGRQVGKRPACTSV
jgi:hypothetical protein